RVHGARHRRQRRQAWPWRIDCRPRVHEARVGAGDRRSGRPEVSQPRPSRRAAPVETDELEAPPPWGRQAWIALLVMGALIAAVVGAGVLVSKALEPAVPQALAHCVTSTQIGPHEFIGPQPMCITAKQKLQATMTTGHGDVVIDLAPEVAHVTVNHFVVLAIH